MKSKDIIIIILVIAITLLGLTIFNLVSYLEKRQEFLDENYPLVLCKIDENNISRNIILCQKLIMNPIYFGMLPIQLKELDLNNTNFSELLE